MIEVQVRSLPCLLANRVGERVCFHVTLVGCRRSFEVNEYLRVLFGSVFGQLLGCTAGLQRRILSEYEYQNTGKHTSSVWTKYMLLSKYTDNAGKEYPFSKLEAGFMAAVRHLVERFDIEPVSDFSAK